MFSFLRRKVGIKIIAGYLIVIGLMLAIGYLALLQLDRISSRLSRVIDNLSGEWAMSNEISHGVEPEEVLARVNTHLALHRLQAQLERMNAQLAQQVVDLEEHNYELDAFAHTVAHDLKNPLMQVIGYADTLLEYERDLPDAERRHGAFLGAR